jgi:hypothetical protein
MSPATAFATSSWVPGAWSIVSRPPRAVRRSRPTSKVDGHQCRDSGFAPTAPDDHPGFPGLLRWSVWRPVQRDNVSASASDMGRPNTAARKARQAVQDGPGEGRPEQVVQKPEDRDRAAWRHGG